ncbi:MAG TPA: beta-ketoacyl-ACP synthase III [Candidatus Dormibacteraeota bacterium]|jgi:3-oxoacyl-[acyl-carrier-protein] synthase-3|nr:beta-ketoacyl-ACP synthase III [Candidatus Dormibacteraeota bacterium]
MAGLNAVITGWGSYVPPRRVPNDELAQIVLETRKQKGLSLDPARDLTNDEWITSHTGIKERRFAGESEYTSTMASKAARRALERAGLGPRDVDFIIVATASPDYLFPSTAALVQNEIGAARAGVIDLEAACTGFLYGLAVARGLILAGTARTVLVIGAETLSRFIDFTDRGTCILFADGAGAVVIEASNASVGIESAVLRADGSKAGLLLLPGGGSRHPTSTDSQKNGLHYIKMSGQETFKLAVQMMSEAAVQAIQDAGLRQEDIDLFVPHQANKRIIDAIAKRLRLPEEKVFINIQNYGNTSAASIPIALCEAVDAGKVKRGDKLLFVAFGGGFTWGACVTEWFGPVDAYRRQSLVGRLQRELEQRIEEIVNR